MGLRKYLGLNRRRHSRYKATVDVEFHVWDSAKRTPRTGKNRGRLTDISPMGACLQTNHTLIDGHHILLDNDPEGQTPVVLTLPTPEEGEQWTIEAQVLWYNRIEAKRQYQFDVGLSFADLSPSERGRLLAFLDSLPTT
ncbi:MAG: PilZ domain-containing protein [Deltaproteobacteria bacterium]|nr:MAG: PilZ domain-containing protein [Deltaproteobacteria bacterium]